MRVPCEAKLSRDDRSLLYRGLAISNTCSHAKNRNDPVPITWSKVAFPEVGFSAVAILGGGWLQSPASDGPPWNGWVNNGEAGDLRRNQAHYDVIVMKDGNLKRPTTRQYNMQWDHRSHSKSCARCIDMSVLFIECDSFGVQGQTVLPHPNPHVITPLYPQKWMLSHHRHFDRFQVIHYNKVVHRDIA